MASSAEYSPARLALVALASFCIWGCSGIAVSPPPSVDQGSERQHQADGPANRDLVDSDGSSGAGDGRLTDGPEPVQHCEVWPASFADGKQPLRELHIATTGDDTAGTGTPGKPFASLWKAADVARPGDAIRIHPGTYGAGATAQHLVGTAEAPIWIGGIPGEPAPVFEGKGLWLSRVRYVVVHDLVFQNTTTSGINIDDGDDYGNADATRYVLIESVNVQNAAGAGQDCIRLQGVDDYTIRESELSGCGNAGSGSGINQIGCHRGLVVRNRIVDSAASGVQAKAGSRDIEIRGNTIERPGYRGINMGGYEEPEFFRPPLSNSGSNAAAENIRAIANVIVGGDASLAFVGCLSCTAANNTLVAPKQWVMRILQENVSDATYIFLPCQDGHFFNNVVSYLTDGIHAHVDVGEGTSAASFSFFSNFWYATDWPAFSDPTLPSAEQNGTLGKDPQFRAPDVGDYSVPLTSPVLGVGKGDPRSTVDHAGYCFRVPPAAGAFEPS